MAWLRHCILRLKDNVKFFGRRVYILSPFRSVADAAARILREIGVTNMRLLTNNPQKRAGLEGYGLRIVENVPIVIPPNEYNEKYLETKETLMGHKLGLFKH